MGRSKIEIHDRENSQENENFLNENRQKFSDQCLKVVEYLNQGKRLTVKWAVNSGIASLPRRIKDLKEGGFNVLDEWVRDGKGKKLYKEWFITITKRPTKKQIQEAFKNGTLVQSKLL